MPTLNLKQQFLSPLLKWPGGKEQELPHILPILPTFQNYYEPFFGGGAVFFALGAKKSFVNDRSTELIQFYQMVAAHDAVFFHALDRLLEGWLNIGTLVASCRSQLIEIYTSRHSTWNQSEWQFLAFLSGQDSTLRAIADSLQPATGEILLAELRKNLLAKAKRMRKLEQSKGRLPESDILVNLESAFKGAFYIYLRLLYNERELRRLPRGMASAFFFFIRENAYASMFRYNRMGYSNVPYGGLSYNNKDIKRKIVHLRSSEVQKYLRNAVIENLDFEEFLDAYPPQSTDLLLLDPPYPGIFSTYAQNTFTLQDHARLAHYLLTRCQAKFLLIIQKTPTILALYQQEGIHIQTFNKTYQVSIKNRNKRHVEHLMVTNY